ncbi:MAG TPA: hypothetical protein VN726_17080 [Hanamia sp.]|nr:hypothetical protein [Hanamia sp.]
MIRKILGIIVGYAIFVLTSLLLFKISKQDPHLEATILFMLFAAFYGLLFSFVAGAVARYISLAKGLSVNYILAFVIAGFAFFSLIKSGGKHWTQFLAIFIFAPTSVLGGMFHNKRTTK